MGHACNPSMERPRQEHCEVTAARLDKDFSENKQKYEYVVQWYRVYSTGYSAFHSLLGFSELVGGAPRIQGTLDIYWFITKLLMKRCPGKVPEYPELLCPLQHHPMWAFCVLSCPEAPPNSGFSAPSWHWWFTHRFPGSESPSALALCWFWKQTPPEATHWLDCMKGALSTESGVLGVIHQDTGWRPGTAYPSQCPPCPCSWHFC